MIAIPVFLQTLVHGSIVNIVSVMLIVKGLVKKKKGGLLIYTYFRGEAAGVNLYNPIPYLSSKGQKQHLNSGSLKEFFFPYECSANNFQIK